MGKRYWVVVYNTQNLIVKMQDVTDIPGDHFQYGFIFPGNTILEAYHAQQEFWQKIYELKEMGIDVDPIEFNKKYILEHDIDDLLSILNL